MEELLAVVALVVDESFELVMELVSPEGAAMSIEEDNDLIGCVETSMGICSQLYSFTPDERLI